jgi:hypothetical protein
MNYLQDEFNPFARLYTSTNLVGISVVLSPIRVLTPELSFKCKGSDCVCRDKPLSPNYQGIPC